MPVAHHKFGRLMLAGDFVGLEMPGPKSRSSAVIKAYWPSRGHDLDSIQYSAMQVGVVQYFLQHKLCYFANNSKKEELHIFACVKWKSLHIHHDWYGVSATICESIPEYCSTNFMPVQRIACRCAYINMSVNFRDIIENVFIACPFSFKYCL